MSHSNSRTPLRVLLVEDQPDDADLIILELTRAGFDAAWQRVETADEMLASLQAASWDIILSDHSMPHFSSSGVLRLLEHTGVDTPCILISGAIGEEAAVSAMRSGASDYILKDNLARLGPAVERELREADVRRKRQQAEELVAHMAYHDPLTGLPNRSLFRDRFEQALVGARRRRRPMAVMFLDVDRFKNINDTLGHSVGDVLLQALADRLRQCMREDDTISRWGGDEFTLLFGDIARVEDAARIAQKILEVLKEPMDVSGNLLIVTASIGIAIYPSDGVDADILLRNADTAMYRVKERGGNHYQMYTAAMNATAFERLALETSLRYALERQQLVVHYQPQIDVHTEKIVGMEALLRWNHPDIGLLFPGQFIPLAEETGLIVPIGLWVLNTACAQNMAWQEAGLPRVRTAVNISVRQFQQRSLVDAVAVALSETGLEPGLLEIEVTEGVAFQASNFALTMLRDFKAMGIQTSIDDFGTGYSSLAALNRFAFDRLKIDQGFVRNVTTNSDEAAIATMIIALAKSLNRKVTAEGVETEDQLTLLRSRGCDEAQGYLFSPAVPPDEASQLLRRWGGIRRDDDLRSTVRVAAITV
ncbi:MAG TPA: EAL domain-containing protein [Armatimonadota bacterium]|nr:EAL domain-containing protein [Armatimonadota bacterium]